MKLKKRNKLRIINGCKGTIALFLAVLMTPFLTIAMILVETGRYNSAVSILDEAMGVSSTSLLASYDEYMKERWGLLAVEQGLDMDATYTEYMNTNIGVLGDSVTLNSVNAKGEFPLSDSEIMYNQIMEYCTLNAPTKLATNFLNLSDLISKLEDIANVGKYFDIIGSGAGAVDASITLAESAEELKDIADDLDELKTSYDSKYTAFESSVSSLAAALSVERPEDESAAIAYDINISNLRAQVDSKKGEYKEIIDDVAEKLGEYKDKMKECSEAMESIQDELESASSTALELVSEKAKKEEELEKIDEKIATMEKNGENTSAPALYTTALEEKTRIESELSELAVEEGMADATHDGLTNVTGGWEESFGSYSDEKMGEKIKGFGNLSTLVNGFSSDSVEATTVLDSEKYYNPKLTGYISSEDIDDYLESQAEEMQSGSLSELIDGIIAFFDSLFDLQLFYDPDLSGYIDVSYYNKTFGGLPGGGAAEGGVLAVITDISNMMSSAANFSKDLVTLKWLDALKEIKNFIESVVSLGKDLLKLATDMARNIYDLFTSYDRLYYSTYTTFNLPCRTDDIPGFTTMTGYEMTEDSLPSKMKTTSVTMIDDLIVLVNQIRAAASGTGSDYTFCGAELEYVLFGSNSEVGNQLYAFVALYILRLILNIPAILLNSEVQSMAASSTLAYPVVILLEILVEPLIDTILLVNGASIDIYKTKIYLTPTGIIEVIEELFSIIDLTSEQKESIGKEVKDGFGVVKDDYDYQQKLKEKSGKKPRETPDLFEFDYREYCFIILLLTVTKEQQMARLSNLIQMETLNYYKSTGASYTFDLRNAYSFVSTETDASVKQILPSLADSSLFNVKRNQHRGY